MDVTQTLLGNFPNTINKESEVFSALVANSNRTGLFEVLLRDIIAYAKTWTETPDIYQQYGKMFEMTAAFFSYLERYTDESDDGFKKRIKTIFQRGGDSKWGNPHDVKNVFQSFFPSANIFLVENTNENTDSNNFLKDGDFQNKSDAWHGISDDPTSNCFYSKGARFSKSFGVELKNTGSFYQTVNFDNSYSDCVVAYGDTYESIAKRFYGNSDIAEYISTYMDNPDTISGPINGTTNVIFSRKIAINKDIVIPKGTIIASNSLNFITQNDAVIIADDSAIKATGYVIFSKSEKTDDDTEIPEGTKISNADGSLIYKTIEDGKIVAGAINSDLIPIEAEIEGDDYNINQNEINTIVSSIAMDVVSVTNPINITNGFNGNNINSNPVLAKAVTTGTDYNVPSKSINTIVSSLEEKLFVTNNEAVTNGYNGDVIKIPSRKTMFLHFFLNGICDVEIKDNNNRYWKPDHRYDNESHKWINGYWQNEANSIHFDTTKSGPKSKAKCDVEFKIENKSAEAIVIPKGSKLKSGNLTFLTSYDARIEIGELSSGPIEAEAEKNGWEYNVPVNSINTMETPIEGVSVTNTTEAAGGSDSVYTKESLYFITDKDVENVTITFTARANCYIDYLRLFEKMPYPSFTIIAQFDTYSGVDAAALYPGQEDTEIKQSHKNASYFDNDFFTGMSAGNFTADLYKELIDYVRSVGVRAYVEIVNKDEGIVEE